MELENKNILITGSNRGIGLALAQQASVKKMRLHLLNRNPSEEVVDELKSRGASSVQNWKIDLSDKSSIDQFLKDFESSESECEILVNNAGQLTGGLLEEQDLDSIYQMLQVNLIGMIHLTRGLLPHMLMRTEAKIVNNASVSGLMFLPCASTYAASKAGVIAFTESLKNELESTNVSTMVMVTPGVKTRMYDKIPDLYSEHLQLDFLSSIPPEQWAEKVFESIEKDKSHCWPTGQSLLGVKMGQHWPQLLGRFVRPYFDRKGK